MNVMERFLRRQMGEKCYLVYKEKGRQDLATVSFSKNQMKETYIYKDMCKKMEGEDRETLVKKEKGISETLARSKGIVDSFIFVLLAYAIGNIVLLALHLNYMVTCAGIVAMGVCFIYKLIEFLKNRFCVLDAYLICLYGEALKYMKSRI